MSPELRAAIENLYVAFGDVPKPEVIEGCPCSIERKGVDVLLGKPLREITPDELSNYAASAFNTVGSLPDYLYLLPRILEVVFVDHAWHPNPEIVSLKFKQADFQEWSDRHRAAVFHYFDAAYNDVLEANDFWLDVDSWVFAVGNLHSNINPYLARLAEHPVKVVEYYEHNSQSLIKGRLTNAFWEEDSSAYQQVLAWFESPGIKKMIKESYGL